MTNILALTAKEDRGEKLSPEEQVLVDRYWEEHAEPLSDELRKKLNAAVKRALADRERRIMGWRHVLFLTHWALARKEPEWHDYWDCSKCHRWPSLPWEGPYDLGREMCTMCEENEATTTWGLPVCQRCFDSLTELQGELKEMEANDPELAEQGRRVEESFERWLEGRDT